MKLAALDLGSNSFHLLVAEADGSTQLRKIGSDKEMLKLGAVVQEHGQLTEAAYQRALTAVGRMVTLARELGAVKVMGVATSALRDARNGQAFCLECSTRYGLDIELLSGDDEARLAYWGARSALPLGNERFLVADVGGGSVELAVGASAKCESVQSLQLGFLRLSRVFPVGEPGGLERLTRYVQVESEKVRWQLGRFDTLIMSGGTARAIGKLLGGGSPRLSAKQMLSFCEDITRRSPQDLLALGVAADRAPNLASGAAVFSGVLAGTGAREVTISPRGLREGVVLRELAQRSICAA
jgi:exopolyphosphatase / guanosine-5'-triphosphate,3'-diphosphate pyrophosphatase